MIVAKRNPYDAMRNIKRNGLYNGFQVQFHRNGESVSKFFAFSAFGNGESEALAAAKEWRDSMEPRLPARQRVVKRTPSKTKYKPLPAGVCKRDTPGHIFQVNWVDATTGEGRLRVFRAGIKASTREINRAMYTAIAFREHYEYCVEVGYPFDQSRYQAWRTQLLFPFDPETALPAGRILPPISQRMQ